MIIAMTIERMRARRGVDALRVIHDLVGRCLRNWLWLIEWIAPREIGDGLGQNNLHVGSSLNKKDFKNYSFVFSVSAENNNICT